MSVETVSSAAVQAQAAPVVAQKAQEGSAREESTESAGEKISEATKSPGSNAAVAQGKSQILETQA